MEKLKMQLTIGDKTYELPKVSNSKYLAYIDARDSLMDKDVFSRADFYAMADCLVELYDKQFNREELIDNGPDLGEIIVQFSGLEAVLVDQVNAATARMKENFTNITPLTTV